MGSGQTHSLGDMIAVFQAITPKALPLDVGQLPNYIPPALVDLTLIKALDWEPSISFKKSLEDVLNFFRNQIKNK
jgi:nucleoside-diphosphate-sugar epimerase